MMQATLALQLLRGEAVAPTLRSIDLKQGRAREVVVTPRADCPTCAPLALDITAERCPMTYVRTKLRLEQLPVGAVLEVLLTGDEPLRNVPRSLIEDGHRIREIVPLAGARHRVRVEKR
jgi:tRNA 2-thiouridine synthesizing protein A